MAKQKPPAFQFYPKDHLTNSGLRKLSDRGYRIYMGLYCHCWLDGSIPDDPVECAVILGRSRQQVEKEWPAIRPLFSVSRKGRLIQRELKYQESALRNLRKNRSESGKKGAQKRWPKNNLDGNAINLPIANDSSAVCSLQTAVTSSLRSEEKPHRPTPAASAGFVRFWTAYPKRVKRGQAERWFRTHKPNDALVEIMVTAIETQKTWRPWREGYIPNPLTWLNGQCWLDEEPPEPTTGPPERPTEYKPDPARLAHYREIEARARAEKEANRVAK